MRFVIFTHSLVSDWNHGNAHFLRGFAGELVSRGHEVHIFEPEAGWSRANLLADQGASAIDEFQRRYPLLTSTLYAGIPDLRRVLNGADVVLVHEWNPPELVAEIGRHRALYGDYRLLFHDTHHRSITEPRAMAAYDLSNYDGVLAYGGAISDAYLRQHWARAAWTWHEAADTRVFFPHRAANEGDLVWIGNWGDDERSAELREFLIEPVKKLGLRACVYGVRYPDYAIQELADAGIEYGGWLPNYRVPEVFARFRVTVHIPRRPYVRSLPGIPTIRPFEALACGIPLISAPWNDSDNLFRPGHDFLFARNEREMALLLELVLSDGALRQSLSSHGLETIQRRHTCSHRVDELFAIVETLQPALQEHV